MNKMISGNVNNNKIINFNFEKEELTAKTITNLQKPYKKKSNIILPKTIPNPKLLLSKSFICYIIISNILVPGTGTIAACRKIKEDNLRTGFYTLGILSLLTAIFVIGYILSIITSIFFYKCYINSLSIEEIVSIIQGKDNNHKSSNDK